MTKKRIKISSAKAKGRNLQNYTAQKIAEVTGLKVEKDGDIEGRQMGSSGADVILRGKAKELFPFDTECFSEDTLVLTKEGYKPIYKITVGEKVLSSKGRFREVTNIFSKQVDSFVMLKSNITSEPISVTENHPFETFNKEFKNTLSLDYTSSFFTGKNEYNLAISKFLLPKRIFKAKILKDHKHILCACGCGTILDRYGSRGRERRFKVGHSGSMSTVILPKSVDIDTDLMYLFGWYIAEGNATNDKVCWTLGLHELNYATKLVEIIHKKFGIKASLTQKKSTCLVIACSKLLSNFFKQLFNTGSPNKKMGKLIFLKKELISSLLRYYFCGDGCVRENFARCETVSRTLAYEIHFSLLRLGILSKISIARKVSKTSSNIRKNNLYSVQISKSSLSRFKKLMNGEDWRYTKFELNFNDLNQIYDFKNGRIYSKVENKIFNKKSIKVYNLEIKEDETYIIQGGIIVHNCKARAKIAIYDFIKQAISNCKSGRDWLLILKKDRDIPVVVMDAEVFFKLYKKIIGKAEILDLTIRCGNDKCKYYDPDEKNEHCGGHGIRYDGHLCSNFKKEIA
jgi:hypothetical protein